MWCSGIDMFEQGIIACIDVVDNLQQASTSVTNADINRVEQLYHPQYILHYQHVNMSRRKGLTDDEIQQLLLATPLDESDGDSFGFDSDEEFIPAPEESESDASDSEVIDFELPEPVDVVTETSK